MQINLKPHDIKEIVLLAMKRFTLIFDDGEVLESYDTYSEAFTRWNKEKMDYFSRTLSIYDEDDYRVTCTPEQYYWGAIYSGLEIDKCDFDTFKEWYLKTHEDPNSELFIRDAYNCALNLWNRCMQ